MILNCAALREDEAAAVRAAVMAGNGNSDSDSNVTSIDSDSILSPVSLPLPDAKREIDSLVVKYQHIVRDMLDRQATELSTAYDADAMSASTYMPSSAHGSSIRSQVQFQYSDVWMQARGFVHTIQLLVRAALQCT